MSPIHSAFLLRQIKQAMRPDAHHFVRPDWRRHVKPGSDAAVVFEIYEAKYSPNQPRIPAGSREGGQWTDANGNGASVPQSRIYAAGWLPKIPDRRPPTSRERTAVAKAVAIIAAEAGVAATAVGETIAKSSWLYYALPSIVSYLDAPKSLDELRQDVSISKSGYDRHHIVEQSSAEEAGYPRKMIDGPDNLVRIPRMKHWEINAWYQTRNRLYDDLSPREYLSGKDWDERKKVGIEALTKFGVLKP